MLQVRDARPSGDCGRTKQLFLSALPAGSQGFRADASFAQAENQAEEKCHQPEGLVMTATLFGSRIH